MSRYLSTALTAMVAAATLHQVGMAEPAAAIELIGLTNNNTLVSFDSDRPTTARKIEIQGIDGTLVGIDFRPANQLLYGVTSSSKIYTIDPATGTATLVSNLSTPFMGGMRSGVDFNPVADRLRLVGANGQNFRVNVETGETVVDKPLAYAMGDRNYGKGAAVSAGAYTNSIPGAKTTQLFDIDSVMDVLVLQSPPNNGALKTIGALDANFSPTAGMDVVTDSNGANTAFAVSGSALYSVDLSKGSAKTMGTINVNNRPVNLIDVAAMPLSRSSAAKP
ncbi:DUF4394 domain-containing protein [Kovacikia minuta CCNUW1]|uniref:DUF4394 domain-containing protein n=1 Tax=Kovacikia minuta TaxID=2931930 RepID=UPI001CCF21CC|nr:DUF4394 domain-containing protein [Kovacikia minuta]UBF27054.1 DUF4394 domain-containing protein [Kovacikia minuta CCNUW1]